MKQYAVESIMRRYGWTGGSECPAKTVEGFFQGGLQEMLCLMIGVQLAAILHHEKVPGETAGRFQKAMSAPVLGSLHEHLLWLAAQETCPAMVPISDEIAKSEKGGRGWMGGLISLRNQWQHPGEKNRQEIIAAAAKILAAPPTYARFFEITGEEGPEVFHELSGCRHSLLPFVFQSGGALHVVKELGPDGLRHFSGDSPEQAALFAERWGRVRLLDPRLASPGVEEVFAKCLAAAPEAAAIGPVPAWLGELDKPGAGARLIDPQAAGGVLANFKQLKPVPACIELALTEDLSLMEAFRERIGLQEPPSVGDWRQWATPERRFILLCRAEGISSKAVLKVLFSLADLFQDGPIPGLHVLISRAKETLEGDQEKLWDRLPDQLETILAPPPRAKGGTLADLLWGVNSGKKFLKLF